ncbi:MAG: glycosyltransferase family 39 protein [Pseudomonadota bacterium]
MYARPESIVNDWMGWRQADTQTIARNFLHNGGNILYPQINWGGNGPGYVESEFQLYPFLIAAVMRLTGEAEYPGQVLSLIFIGLSALIIYIGLTGYFGYGAALAGMMVFLTAQGPVHLSTSIQPDALCFLFYAAGFFTFLKYIQEPKISFLVWSTMFAVFAGLVKPTALNLCAIQFLIIIFKNSNQLRNPWVWLSWVITIGIVSLYLVHGYNLYLTYGNTFGVIGGDSKFPTLQSLLNPVLYLKLFYMTIAWGIGAIGAIAAFCLSIKRKIKSIEWALLGGSILVVMIAFRYTTSRGYGPHYHIFTSLLGSWVVAHFVSEASKLRSNKQIVVVLTVLISIQYALNLFMRQNPLEFHLDPSVVCMGNSAAAIIGPKELVIARSVANERSEPIWGSWVNNYEDPRIFYLANISGWCFASDDRDPEKFKKFIASGARFFIELGSQNNKANEILYAWLQQHATLVFNQDCGRIYKFF